MSTNRRDVLMGRRSSYLHPPVYSRIILQQAPLLSMNVVLDSFIVVIFTALRGQRALRRRCWALGNNMFIGRQSRVCMQCLMLFACPGVRELNQATILEALAFLGCSRRFILPDCIIFLSDSLILRFVRACSLSVAGHACPLSYVRVIALSAHIISYQTPQISAHPQIFRRHTSYSRCWLLGKNHKERRKRRQTYSTSNGVNQAAAGHSRLR